MGSEDQGGARRGSESTFIGCAGASGAVLPAFGGLEPLAGDALLDEGTWGLFALVDGTARLLGEPLAGPGTARARIYALAAERGLDPLASPAAVAEAEALVARPGIDDPRLLDLTHLPFVTIDEVSSGDLDQAVCIERGPGRHEVAFVVWYAIADPAWGVRPGTALFDEALRRGSTYYLPGLVVPMLPRMLSEGVISLSEGVDRRAMVFEVGLRADGTVAAAGIHRARVRSRVKTSFGAVQAFLDGRGAVPGGLPEVGESLRGLEAVGRLRMGVAEARDVVAIRRREVEVRLSGGDEAGFVGMADLRNDVERHNEQISLLCNVEGARFLRRGDRPDDRVQPIYRTHRPPAAERVAALAEQIEGLVGARGLDPSWRWRRDAESLAGYLARLPDRGPEARVARAIHRQAMLSGGRSAFTDTPGRHYGVGADVYARFTAPMREVVGIFVHRETWQKLGLEAPEAAVDDEALRELVIAAANRSRGLQRELDQEANLLVLDDLFGADRTVARDDRPRRRGTIMGVSRSKVHVELDDPPIAVKVYLHHLSARAGRQIRQSSDRLSAEGAAGERLCTVGDEVALRVVGRDEARRRWELEILPP